MILALATTGYASACDVNERFVEFLGYSSRAFVGTVVGYRLNDTSLAFVAPDCPFAHDDPRLSAECIAFWQRVVSIQYDVEIAISGIETNRKYEMSVWNPDGCVPRIGERWLTSGWYRDGFSTRLSEFPAPEQVAEWRAIVVGDGEP